MVATLSNISPISYDNRGTASAEERSSLPEVVNYRIQECLQEAGGWLSEARLCQRYYRSDQYRRQSNHQDRNRIRLVANFIRRDVDLMVAELLAGEPIVNPSGRNAKHYELGRLLVQVLQWTRDEEDDWDQDLEMAIVDCVHIGEGVIFEGWNQDADRGNGLPTAKRLDSRYVFWDWSATDMQRDDADYIVWLEQRPIEQIEDMWPQLNGRIQPETAETFIPLRQQDYYRASLGKAYVPLLGRQNGQTQRAWIRRQWSKKRKFRHQYWDRETWDPVMLYDPAEDSERRMNDADWAELDAEEREGIYRARTPYHELWETVVVGNVLVDHRISPFDESNGGHGRYPFGFFSCNILADESHARGEIGFLIQVQDITNEAITQYLNQLFIANASYMHSIKGSLDPEEEDKVPRIGSDPLLHISSRPGFEPPTIRGFNPTGMQAAASAIPLIKNVIMDSMSGIHRVDRGESEWSGMSGRAVRALQSRSSLLSQKLVRHIESGLKRCTLLRLHNIMQFMRGNRVMQVAAPDTERGEKTLIIGHDEVEMVAYHGLKVERDEENNTVKFIMRDGNEAELLVLNDEVAREVVYEQVRLTLDTSQEKNKLERHEDAREVLRTIGAPSVEWAAKQLEWSDPELLLEGIKKADAGQQIMGQLEQLAKQSGMEIPDLMQQIVQMVQQQMGGAQGQPAGAMAAPAGPTAPPPGPGPMAGPGRAMPPPGPAVPGVRPPLRPGRGETPE